MPWGETVVVVGDAVFYRDELALIILILAILTLTSLGFAYAMHRVIRGVRRMREELRAMRQDIG